MIDPVVEPMGLGDLSDETPGVLPNQLLEAAIAKGYIEAPSEIPDRNVQPSSLDLRLGDVAYSIRCSFLPDDTTLAAKLDLVRLGEVSLADGAVLLPGQPYLIPLLESIHLPQYMRARANPKSSTGRLDVFTRVITDHSYRFDDISTGYDGPLYLEVVPLSFPVLVRTGDTLNQLRLSIGDTSLGDRELWSVHEADPLLFVDGHPASKDEFAVANGLFVSLDLQGDRSHVGYRAKRSTPAVDISAPRSHVVESYWEHVYSEQSHVILEPERFYLLLSREGVRIPPGLASEMTAYDPTSGELRTHYAGFFDPGFGHDPADASHGSRAALEVRAHDVPFMVEHGQRVCKLTFEHMLFPPSKLYGSGVSSNYQGQTGALGKHFIV